MFVHAYVSMYVSKHLRCASMAHTYMQSCTHTHVYTHSHIHYTIWLCEYLETIRNAAIRQSVALSKPLCYTKSFNMDSVLVLRPGFEASFSREFKKRNEGRPRLPWIDIIKEDLGKHWEQLWTWQMIDDGNGNHLFLHISIKWLASGDDDDDEACLFSSFEWRTNMVIEEMMMMLFCCCWWNGWSKMTSIFCFDPG